LEIWSAKMQVNIRKTLVAFDIARTELRDELKRGDVIHRTYVSNVGTAAYVPGTDVVITGATATDDSITVDQKYISAFYINYLCTLGETLLIKFLKLRETLYETIRSQARKGRFNDYNRNILFSNN